MLIRKSLALVVLSAALATGSIGCAARTVNPVLSPPAQLASSNGRVVHALDVIRNGALIFTNDQNTGQLTLPLARRLVVTHADMIRILDARGQNFVRIIQASLVALNDLMPPALNLGPYFFLANTLLEVLSNRDIDVQLSAETIAAYEKARDETLAFDAAWLARH